MDSAIIQKIYAHNRLENPGNTDIYDALADCRQRTERTLCVPQLKSKEMKRVIDCVIQQKNNSGGNIQMQEPQKELAHTNQGAVQLTTSDQVVQQPQNTTAINNYRGSAIHCNECSTCGGALVDQSQLGGAYKFHVMPFGDRAPRPFLHPQQIGGQSLAVDQSVGPSMLSAPTPQAMPVWDGRSGYMYSDRFVNDQPLYANQPFTAYHPAPLPTAYFPAAHSYNLAYQGSQGGYTLPPMRGGFANSSFDSMYAMNKSMANHICGNTSAQDGRNYDSLSIDQNVGRDFRSAPSSIERQPALYEPMDRRVSSSKFKLTEPIVASVLPEAPQAPLTEEEMEAYKAGLYASRNLPNDILNQWRKKGYVTLSQYLQMIGVQQPPPKQKSLAELLEELFKNSTTSDVTILIENIRRLGMPMVEKIAKKLGVSALLTNAIIPVDKSGKPKDPQDELFANNMQLVPYVGLPGLAPLPLAPNSKERNDYLRIKDRERKQKEHKHYEPTEDNPDEVFGLTHVSQDELSKLILALKNKDKTGRLQLAKPTEEELTRRINHRADNLVAQLPEIPSSINIDPRETVLGEYLPPPVNILGIEWRTDNKDVTEEEKKMPMIELPPKKTDPEEFQPERDNYNIRSITIKMKPLIEAIHAEEGGDKRQIEEGVERAIKNYLAERTMNPRMRDKPQKKPLYNSILASYFTDNQRAYDEIRDAALKNKIRRILIDNTRRGGALIAHVKMKRGGTMKYVRLVPKRKK